MNKNGLAIQANNSALFSGSLGMVGVAFNGYNLGKTTAETVLKVDQDIKDITFQQDGSKPADHIRTGIEYMLTATFGEISTKLITLLMSGFTLDASNEDVAISQNMYTSMLQNEAKPLKIIAYKTDGVESTDEIDTLNFYRAIPIIDDTLLNWGFDSQRNLAVTFKIKSYKPAEPNDYTIKKLFGYVGSAEKLGVPAIDWPNGNAPSYESASILSAKTAEVIFDKAIAFQGSAANKDGITILVGGKFITPLTATITDKKLSLTFADGSFTADSIAELAITNAVIKSSGSDDIFEGVDLTLIDNSI